MNARASQTLTLALAGICGLLLLVVVLLEFGFGRGYRWWQPDEAGAAANGGELNRTSFKLSPWDKFADVNTRPLFNEDRKPTPVQPDAPPPDNKPIPKLNAILSGVILSPHLRAAMIKENGKVTSTVIKEGGALPGDLSAWSLAQIKPRAAVFKNTAGEEVTVELIAAAIDQKPTPPPQPQAPPPAAPMPPPPAPPQADASQTAKTAEPASADLQQRIEARRQQLREQNAKGQPQQQ